MTDHLVGGLHCAEAADFAPSFVLGALEPREAEAVRAHLAGCPEPHAEFAELGSVVPALVDAVEVVQPPAALRDRILAAAAADRPHAVVTERPAQTPAASDPQRAIEIPRLADARRPAVAGVFRRPLWTAIGIAAALALVALGAWNLRLQDDLSGLTAYRNGVAAVLNQAAQADSQLAVLSTPGQPAGPSGLVAISNGGTKVAMVMRDLVPTRGTEVYEAWIIVGESAPVPIGSFTVGDSGIVAPTMTLPPSAKIPAFTVALTREPQTGATTPTLPIIAAGIAS